MVISRGVYGWLDHWFLVEGCINYKELMVNYKIEGVFLVFFILGLFFFISISVLMKKREKGSCVFVNKVKCYYLKYYTRHQNTRVLQRRTNDGLGSKCSWGSCSINC